MQQQDTSKNVPFYLADEGGILAGLHSWLCAQSPAALHARVLATASAEPDAVTTSSSDVQAVVRGLLAPSRAQRQYALGCLMQSDMTRSSPFGTRAECEEEARAWFLAAARNGHAGADEAVALHFLTRPVFAAAGSTAMTFSLPCCYHDAAFWLWRSASCNQRNEQTRALLATLTHNETRKQMYPLAMKDVRADAESALDGEARQRLVTVLHLGHRLADAASPPCSDAAAQFLLATQHAGTPVAFITARFPPASPPPAADEDPMTMTMTMTMRSFTYYMLRVKPDARLEDAQPLLRASAAQGYTPAVALLRAIEADGAPFAQAAPRALGALSDELAYMLREKSIFGTAVYYQPHEAYEALRRATGSGASARAATLAGMDAAVEGHTGIDHAQPRLHGRGAPAARHASGMRAVRAA
jgi:hypothetical protein